MKEGEKHFRVMLTFFFVGGGGGGDGRGATHQENGCLSPDKIVPPRRR